MFNLLNELKIKPLLSLSITLIYIVTPATILYENIFFYTHLIIFFFVSAAYYLIRYFNTQKIHFIHLHFCFLLLISLTTSFFHIVWYFLIILILIYFLKTNRKQIIVAASIQLIILLSVYLKNFLVFGDFNTSSWFGMNLSRMTVYQMPADERLKLFEERKLSEVSLLPPFPQKDDILKLKTIKQDSLGFEILDNLKKSSSKTNFNNNIYLKISDAAFNDSKFIITKYPEYYWAGIKQAFVIYFTSPSEYKPLNQNIPELNYYSKIFNKYVYGAFFDSTVGYVTIILTIIIVFSVGFLILKKDLDIKIKIVLIFMLINIFYVMIIGNFLEVGENNRFRFYTEIFSYVLLAYIINTLTEKVWQKKNSIITST